MEVFITIVLVIVGLIYFINKIDDNLDELNKF
jgi:hypothetical protein